MGDGAGLVSDSILNVPLGLVCPKTVMFSGHAKQPTMSSRQIRSWIRCFAVIYSAAVLIRADLHEQSNSRKFKAETKFDELSAFEMVLAIVRGHSIML